MREVDKKAKILIVENNTVVMTDLAARLINLGYEISGEAGSTQQALEMIKRGLPDLVLMGTKLQGEMEGFEAAAIIRNTWRVPIVFLTTHGDQDCLGKADISYPFGYLQRPFKNWEIKHSVDMALYIGQLEVEKHEAEEKSRERGERFQLAFDNANIGMSLVSMEGRLLKVNAQMSIIFGYSPDELERMTVNDIAHPEDVDISPTFIRRAISGEIERTQFQKRYIHKDGHVIWCQVVSSIVRDAKGAPLYFISHLLDITEKKRADQTLEKSKREWEEIFQAIGHPALILDPEYHILNANRAALSATGKKAEELVGKLCYEIFHHRMEPPPECPLNNLRLTGKAEKADMEVEALEGTYVVACTPVFNDRGILEKVIHVATDITEHKRTEKRLSHAERRYRNLFDDAPALYVITENRKGVPIIVDCNTLFLDTLGYSREKILNHPLADVYSPGSRRLLLDNGGYQRALSGRFTYEERELLTSDGKIIQTVLHAVPELDVTGQVIGTRAMFMDITERKNIENALMESEERYRRLLQQAPIGIAVHCEGKLVFSNPAGVQLLGGTSEDELIGKPITDIIHPDRLAEAQDRIRRMMSGEKNLYPVNDVYKKLDGTSINVEVMAIPINYRGKPAVQVTVKDITFQMQAQAALRESEQRFRTIFEKSTGGFSLTSLKGELLQVNPAFAGMLGYSVAEMEKLNWAEITHPEDIAVSREAIRCLLAKEQTTYSFEKRYYHRNGSIVWAMVSTTLLRDENDHPLYFITDVHNISSRKWTEEQLRKLSQAVQQNPASILITDTQGNIEYVNTKFTEVTGFTLDEVVGKTPRILKSGETPAEEYQALWETINAGREWHGEFHNKRKDGSLFWERASISPIRDLNGKITHYLAIKEDITEEKALQAQLLQAQKMEAVGRLAGGVAHDFNNMLLVILGNSELAMLMIDAGHPVYESLKEIIKAANRSVNLTRQLLAFARKQTIKPQILDLNETVASMLKMLQRLIGEDIELVWKPAPSLWPVKIDPAQIDQILANLAVNARDAISNVGNLIIETENVVFDETYAKSHPALLPGEFVLLAVSDTGSGISQEILPRIFEPFFTTKAEGQGTGLGLATVYGIVKQNNGFVNIYSELGQGTTFNIYLPRTMEETTTKYEADARKMLPGTETVLIVEDDPSILNFSQIVLKRCGYTVLAAQTPAEALALVERHEGPIHLLLTDVVMPEMNGKELSNRLVSLRPGIKVLYMSGYTADVIAHRGVIEDNLQFLQKPFSLSALTAKVRETLDIR